MYHLSLGKSSKPQSPLKVRLLGELEDANRSLTHKEEEMRQLVERMQRLEDAQERQAREGDVSLEELLDIICIMGVKNNIGESTIWEKVPSTPTTTKEFFSFCKVT